MDVDKEIKYVSEVLSINGDDHLFLVPIYLAAGKCMCMCFGDLKTEMKI